MNISGSMVFYWFCQDFPNAIHINPELSKPLPLDAPLFYDSKIPRSGHVVVFTPECSKHIVHLKEPFLPVLVGISAEQAAACGIEAILLEEPVAVNRVFNCLQGIFHRFLRWEQDLSNAANRFFSFDAIIRSCDTLLDDPLALADSQFRYVSYSKRLAYENGYEAQYVDEENYLPLEYINQLTAMPDFRQTEQSREVYQYVCVGNMLHKNIFHRGQFVGRLALPYSRQEHINRYYSHILLEVSHWVEQLYEQMGSFWHKKTASNRLSVMLLDLLEGRQVEMDILRRSLGNQGWVSGDDFLLIQMKSHFTANEQKLTNALISQLEKAWPGACCLSYQQRLVVLLNKSHYRRSTGKLFNQELAVFLRESLLLAGISRSFRQITDIRAAFHQADIAMEAGEQLTPMYWYFKYDDYAFWDLLHHGCRNFLPEQVCHRAINTLMDYDRENNTELSRTLQVYIEKQYNAVSAASELCIARSTFLKRFSRIQELTHIDLENLQERIYLALSYELFRQYYA